MNVELLEFALFLLAIAAMVIVVNVSEDISELKMQKDKHRFLIEQARIANEHQYKMKKLEELKSETNKGMIWGLDELGNIKWSIDPEGGFRGCLSNLLQGGKLCSDKETQEGCNT